MATLITGASATISMPAARFARVSFVAATPTITGSNVISALGYTPADAADLADYAPLASPSLTGTPTAPTAAGGTNTTQIATTAFVKAAIDALIDASPGALDTLNELAAALGDDPNFATTVTDVAGFFSLLGLAHLFMSRLTP